MGGVGALAAITALSYLDRQALPVMIGAIQQEIPISNAAFSRLQAAFLLAGLMHALSLLVLLLTLSPIEPVRLAGDGARSAVS